MKDVRNKEQITYLKDCPQYRGRSELIKHLEGKRLTLAQAIEAHCYECAYIGYGAVDCGVPLCPLYPYAPYSENKAPRRAISEATRARLRAGALERKKKG